MPLAHAQTVQALDCLARCAGLMQDAWHEPRRFTRKGPIDLVSPMDLRLQEELAAGLRPIAPGAALLGEEGADPHALPPAGPCWVIDPIDGTTNFVHGLPMTCITAAFCEDGVPVFGMTACPMMNETWWAARGQGAWLNGRPIHVSAVDSLADGLVATGFPYDIRQTCPAICARLSGVLVQAQGVRRIGAASLDLAYVAMGRLDAYYEGNLKPWDYMAGWLLCLEAGGTVSDDEGRPYQPGRVICASNGRLHAELLAAMHAGDRLLAERDPESRPGADGVPAGRA